VTVKENLMYKVIPKETFGANLVSSDINKRI